MFCIRARLQSCRKSMKIRWALAPATARVTKNSIFSHPAEARLIGLAVLLRTSQLVGSPTNSAGEETGCEAGLWRVDYGRNMAPAEVPFINLAALLVRLAALLVRVDSYIVALLFRSHRRGFITGAPVGRSQCAVHRGVGGAGVHRLLQQWNCDLCLLL
jgi:hypothetical protein